MQKYNNERKVSTGNRVVRKMTKLHPCQNSLKFWLATMLRDNQEDGEISDIDEQWTNRSPSVTIQKIIKQALCNGFGRM